MTNKYGSSATIIPVEMAAGTVLAHDITEIRPGRFKGTAFKKGYIIQEDDIPHLRRLGKEHLYVLHLASGEVHEDDAALKLCSAFAGPGITFDNTPSEGKISLKAAHRGLLKVNVEALTEINLVPDICCSSRHNNILVEKGEIIAATRAIPLIIDGNHLDEAVGIAQAHSGIFSVQPMSKPLTGILITGNEVYSGLIEDKFAPTLREKLRVYGCRQGTILYTPDEIDSLVAGFQKLIESGSELIMVGGGMSVDPDDLTRLAILEAGAKDVVYGTPVLPGAMFLFANLQGIPLLGLPACVLSFKATVLDLFLPRILAGEKITRKDFAAMAHGGLCLSCASCRYPICPFGKA